MTNASKLPSHVAIIMDGNGRWARERGFPRLQGHRAGAKSVRTIVEESRRLGIRYLTLFSFSTENWNRGALEVAGLMGLFEEYLQSELDTLLKNGIRLRAIGNLERLPEKVRLMLEKNIRATAHLTGMDLVLALSYGGREEIVQAAKRIGQQVANGKLAPADITEQCFRDSLFAPDIPDPELLIRTSGEMRISNFLLWQLAYSEIVVVPEYWPDFDEKLFQRCLTDYSSRERRFGMTSEQLRSVA